jgi:peptidoglycan hydrolase-like protein with peptidoglycan-binding domain
MAFRALRFQRCPRLQAAADNKPALRIGETSVAVKILQQALLDLGYPMPISTRRAGRPDGIFGDETQATVTAFQQTQGLSADGVAGRHTLHRLDVLFAIREAAAKASFAIILNAPPPGGWYTAGRSGR